MTNKKAWEFLHPPVPHLEAFALPSTVERATQKPTPDMSYYTPIVRTIELRPTKCKKYTSRRTSTVAMSLTVLKICEVSKCQAQSVVNAVFKCHAPSLLPIWASVQELIAKL